jgi:hypothetical protein
VFMFDLDLCLIVSVLLGLSHNYTLINYVFINKVGTNYIVISYLCEFATIPLPLLSLFWVFFISSTLRLQMANTRNRNNNTKNNNGENNQDANQSPPPPTLEQVLAMQAQMHRPCKRPWSTCRLLSPRSCYSCQGMGLETFSALSHRPYYSAYVVLT